MQCSFCHNETDNASLFCHVCDTYRTDPAAGTKASLGLRLLAHILDAAVFLVVFVIIAAASCAVAGIGALAVAPGARGPDGLAAAGTVGTLGVGTFFMAFVAYLGFLLVFLAKGKTPGKAISGIRVADKRTGGLPGIGRMLLREILGKVVSGFFFGLGYFWAIFDRDAQTWHDKIAGTVVLMVKPSLAGMSPALGTGSNSSVRGET